MPVHRSNYRIGAAVYAEKMRAEVGKIGLIINSFVSQEYRYFSAHRAPMKPALYWTDMFCWSFIRAQACYRKEIPEDVKHWRTHLCSVLFQLCVTYFVLRAHAPTHWFAFSSHLLNHLVVDSELDGCAMWSSVFLVSILSFNTWNCKKRSNSATNMLLFPWNQVSFEL